MTLPGSFTDSGERGGNRVSFSGRVGVGALKKGRYRLRARATDAAGNTSPLKRASFQVISR